MNIFQWLNGEKPIPRMPLKALDRHENHDYHGNGKFTVTISPAKQKLVDERMLVASDRLTAAAAAATATFTAASSAAKKAYDDAIANAKPLRDKAIAAANLAYEAERIEISRWAVVPATAEEVAAFVTHATPAGHVVQLTPDAAKAAAKAAPAPVTFTPVATA